MSEATEANITAAERRATAIKEPTATSASRHFWGSGMYSGLIDEVWKERERQIKKWGVQERRAGTSQARWRPHLRLARAECRDNNELGTLSWVHILQEEVFEAFEAMEPGEYREELIQVMAVCASMILDLDRRGMDAPAVETNGD